jgi:hypothetical protein
MMVASEVITIKKRVRVSSLGDSWAHFLMDQVLHIVVDESEG